MSSWKKENKNFISLYHLYKGAFFRDLLDQGTIVQDHSDLGGSKDPMIPL